MTDNQPRAIKVYFEVTNFCNFDCDFCPSHDSTRKRQHMDLALFQKGIEDIVQGHIADTVGFHILGEPLLYPMLYDALAYARSRGLHTEINTNGSLLTPERVARLVESGLGQLAISVQTVGEQAYECRGAGMPYHVYYQRVMDAVRQIKESGSEMDVVLCFMDTSTKRFFDIDKLMRLGKETDTVGHKLAPFILDLYAAIGQSIPRHEVEAAVRRLNLSDPKFVRLDAHLKVYVQPLADWGNAFTAKKVYPAKIGACGYALSNVGVLNNGEVTICCADYDGKTSLGNLGNASLASLLSSERAQAIREGFAKAKIVHPYCQRCIGSPHRLKAMLKGLASIYLFKLLDFQPARVKEVALVPA